MKIQTWRWAGLALLLLVPAARAQEKAEAAAAEPHARLTPLRVLIVFSKYEGEKKVASLPYTLTCNAGDRGPAVLRMGIEVPVPVSKVKDAAAIQEFQYKNVGTNIDCRTSPAEDGRYRLELNIEQSSIYSPAEEKVTPTGKERDKDGGRTSWGVTDMPLGGAPLFRSFRAQFVPLLRDGQTVQYTAATDPVSGEVVKIDVTVTVLK